MPALFANGNGLVLLPLYKKDDEKERSYQLNYEERMMVCDGKISQVTKAFRLRMRKMNMFCDLKMVKRVVNKYAETCFDEMRTRQYDMKYLSFIIIVCLIGCGRGSYYPTVRDSTGAIHIGCNYPGQCLKVAKKKCMWGYDIKSHSDTEYYYKLTVVCR